MKTGLRPFSIFFTSLFLVIITSAGWSSVPTKIAYEGRLVDPSGNPITTAKNVSFSIFDAATAGSLVWGPESQSVTPDSQGVFSVLLGATTAVSPEVFNSSSRYLEISIAGETLTPRVQLVSVGYAFKTALAQGVEDGTITRAKAASGQFVKQIVAGSGIGVSGDEGSGTGVVTLTATGTGGGTVSQVDTGTGLTGGPVTTAGTISLVVPVLEANGGTNQSTYATGDILYASSSNTLAKLPVGSAGQILKVSGGTPSWGSAGGTGTVTQVDTGTGLTGGPVTTTGTISVDAGTTANKIVQLDSSAKLPAVDGSALTGLTKTQVGLSNVQNVDTTNAGNISSGTMVEARGGTNQSSYATGDILYASGANTLAKLPVGTAGQVLKVSGGIPAWATAGGTGTVTQVDTGTGLTGGPVTATGVISVDAGTTANKIVQLDASAKLPAVDGSSLTGLTKTQVGLGNVQNVDTTNAGNISSGTLGLARGGLGSDTSASTQGSVLYNNGSAWVALGPGTSGQVLQTQGASANPQWASAATGSVTSVGTGNGLTGGPITATGVISVDAGTTANKIVQLDSSAKLPAVDGSALTGLTKTQVSLGNVQNVDQTNAANITSGTIATARLGSGSASSANFLRGDQTWAAGNNGTVTQVDTGTGLTGGPITSTGTLAVNVGTGANQIVQLDPSAKLPAVDGSALTGLTKGQINLGNVANVDTTNASNLSSGTLSDARLSTNVVTLDAAQTLVNKTISGASNTLTNLGVANLTIASQAQGDVIYYNGSNWTRLPAGSSGQVLQTQGGSANPQWASAATGSVTSVGTGNGLVGGPITATGVISVDAGTTANKIIQLDSSAKLPAVDGSALTGLTKTQVGLGNVQNVDQTDAANITSGTLALARGGTNATSFTSSQLVRMNAGGTALESSGKTVPTGNIVGDTDTQNLTNKTLDSTNSITGEAIKTGLVGTARLGSGTANNTTFLRGDQTWAAPGGSGTVTSVQAGNGLISSPSPITTTGIMSVDTTVVVDHTSAQSLSNKTFTGPTTMAAVTATTLSSSGQYTNTVAVGTAPIVITSTTEVTNLNAQLTHGLFVQSGTSTCGKNSTATVTLPIAYSQATYAVVVSVEDSNSGAVIIVDTATAKTSSAFTVKRNNTGAATDTFDWITVGPK